MVRLSSLLRRFMRASDGAAVIEFAIVVPVFLMFVFGIIEGGRMLWIRNSIQTATEEAGRFAMAHTTATDTELITHATDYFDSVGIDNPTFTVVRDTTGGMDFVTISGVYSFQPMVAIIDFGSVQLDGKARVPLVE